MTHRDGDIDPFVGALQRDLPSAEHEKRTRARLLSAGILAAGGTTSGIAGATAGATATGTQVGWVAKLTAWSGLAKVGVAVGVAGVGIPVAWQASVAIRAVSEPPRVSAAPPASSTPPAVGRVRIRGQEAGPPARAESTDDVARPPTAPQKRQRLTIQPRPAPVEPGTTGEPRAAPRAAASFPDLDADPLKEETRLIERALAALRAGNDGEAERWLEVHRTRYPNGLLAPERERALARVRHSP